MLPSVAVRTMVNRHAIALLQPRHFGHVVADAGGNERHARADSLIVTKRRFEEIAGVREVGHRDVAGFDTVWAQFLASEPQKLQRWDTVAAEETVQCGRAGVPRLPRIAKEHTTSAACEYERGAETSWTAADNDDVEHAPAELQATGHCPWGGSITRR